MSTTYGYARCSTTKQDLALQRSELKARGCKIIEDPGVSGKTMQRPGIQRLLRDAVEGDTVIVYKLDRVSRSTRDILNFCHELNEAKIQIVSLHDGIDTTPKEDPFAEVSRQAFIMFTALFAQMDRAMIVARTTAGRKFAKENGVPFGRDPRLTPDQVAMARSEREKEKGMSVAALAKSFHVHPSTLYRYLADDERAEKALKTLAVRENKRRRRQ